jgi:ankyrin repeat protein
MENNINLMCLRHLYVLFADVLNDRNGLTTLHHSVGHGSVVKLILEAGASVDAVDCCGWTPLMRAGNENQL